MLVDVKNYNSEIYFIDLCLVTSRDPRRLRIYLWKTKGKRRTPGFGIEIVVNMQRNCSCSFLMFSFSVPFLYPEACVFTHKFKLTRS